MASYKLIVLAFMFLIVLPNTLTMADNDDVPGAPDNDDDGPPRTPTPTTPPYPTTPPFSSLLPPPIGDVCARTDCGHGTCVANSTNFFGYKCVCEPGWRRTIRSYDQNGVKSKDDDPNNHENDENLGFIGCLFPDCNLNYTSCKGSSAPPAPQKPAPLNSSAFDPCSFADCGEGTCIKSPDSDVMPACKCNPGVSNLLNIPYFPCYTNCQVGDDCLKYEMNNGDDKNNGLADGINTDNGSQAILPRNFYWVGTLMAVALALWH